MEIKVWSYDLGLLLCLETQAVCPEADMLSAGLYCHLSDPFESVERALFWAVGT